MRSGGNLDVGHSHSLVYSLWGLGSAPAGGVHVRRGRERRGASRIVESVGLRGGLPCCYQCGPHRAGKYCHCAGSKRIKQKNGMADRYLIENREAAVGVQMFHLRQRWGAAVWRAQTQVLLGRLKCALPGWEGAESRRRTADTAAPEASFRSHASGYGARDFDAGS
jgi:hypothetical protein